MFRTSEEMFEDHANIHRRVRDDGLLSIPFCHVTQWISGRIELQLSGRLPHDWCLRLAKGLSAAHIGLLNGYARHVGDQIWICQLEVEPGLGARRMPDFLDLALNGTLRRRGKEPPILDYEITARDARQEAVVLRVVAHDAVGLLAAVLQRVRGVGLIVDELVLATEDDAAVHRIAIRRPDLTIPTALDRRAIAASLDQLVRSR